MGKPLPLPFFTSPLSFFYRPDALPAAQPAASQHWRHIIRPSNKHYNFKSTCICLPYPPLTAGSEGMPPAAGYKETNWSPCTSVWAKHTKTQQPVSRTCLNGWFLPGLLLSGLQVDRQTARNLDAKVNLSSERDHSQSVTIFDLWFQDQGLCLRNTRLQFLKCSSPKPNIVALISRQCLICHYIVY